MSQLVLTLAEAAAFLKLHPNTVRSHAKRALIPAIKVGRNWRFVEGDLVAWMRDGYSAAARMQSSAYEKEAIWHSIDVQALTTLSSQHRTERQLDALLGRTTRKRP